LKTLIFKRLLKTCRYNERWEVGIVNDYLKNSWWCFDQDSTIGNWGFKKRKAKWVRMDVINLFILKRLNWKIIMTEQSEKKKTNQFIWKIITRCIAKSKTGKFLWENLKAQDEKFEVKDCKKEGPIRLNWRAHELRFLFQFMELLFRKECLFRLFQRCKRKN